MGAWLQEERRQSRMLAIAIFEYIEKADKSSAATLG
jgi:hypothetical protein